MLLDVVSEERIGVVDVEIVEEEAVELVVVAGCKGEGFNDCAVGSGGGVVAGVGLVVDDCVDVVVVWVTDSSVGAGCPGWVVVDGGVWPIAYTEGMTPKLRIKTKVTRTNERFR